MPTNDQVRPFADFIRDVDRGVLHDELSEALIEVAEAVEDSGRPGSITVTFKFKKTKSDLGPQVEVTSGSKVNAPKPTRDPSRFFLTADGNLTRSNPRQAELDFTGPREVPTPAPTEAREVPAAGPAREVPTGTNG